MADLLKIKQISGLSADLSDLVVVDNSIETKVSTDISAEASTRLAADNSLDAYVDGVSGDLDTAEAAATAEASSRLSGDTSLDAYVDGVSGDLDTAEAAATAEASSRLSGDVSLDAYVDSVSGDLSTEISATNADIASIEDAFVKDPLGNERFLGSSAAFSSQNAGGGTLAENHTIELSGIVEGTTANNVIGVYINGLVADPGYYAVAGNLSTGGTDITFETSYELENTDTIIVKFVKD